MRESSPRARLTTERELLEFLDKHGLPYQRVEHEPVYTCEQAELLRPAMPAASTKNLFLSDKKGRHFFLAVTACEKNLDLRRLAGQLGVSRLHFGSEARLLERLGVRRGAVTMLGLINDTGHAVQLWLDTQVWEADNFLCHPLVNTATLLLSKASLMKFFELTGHPIHLFEA